MFSKLALFCREEEFLRYPLGELEGCPNVVQLIQDIENGRIYVDRRTGKTDLYALILLYDGNGLVTACPVVPSDRAGWYIGTGGKAAVEIRTNYNLYSVSILRRDQCTERVMLHTGGKIGRIWSEAITLQVNMPDQFSLNFPVQTLQSIDLDTVPFDQRARHLYDLKDLVFRYPESQSAMIKAIQRWWHMSYRDASLLIKSGVRQMRKRRLD